MRARILPVDEFWRLQRTGMPPFTGIPQGDVAVVVVEKGEEIVASMTVLKVAHFEGAWIDPAHRNAGVVRSLYRASADVAKGWGNEWVFAGADDDRMRRVLDRLNGVRVMDTYVLSLGEECHKQPS